MDIQGSIGNMIRRLLEIQINLNGLVSVPESDRIYWAELAPNGYRLSLQAAPLHIGSLMEQHMWNQKSSYHCYLRYADNCRRFWLPARPFECK